MGSGTPWADGPARAHGGSIRPTIGMVLEDEFTFLQRLPTPARRRVPAALTPSKGRPMHVSVNSRLFPGCAGAAHRPEAPVFPTPALSGAPRRPRRHHPRRSGGQGITPPAVLPFWAATRFPPPKPDPEGLQPPPLTAPGLEPRGSVLRRHRHRADGEAARRGWHFITSARCSTAPPILRNSRL